MKTKNKRELSRAKRHAAIRLRVRGDKSRPRLLVGRSLKNMRAQLIDDTENKTLFSQNGASCGNVKTAQLFGESFAAKAKEKGITRVVFDRAGYLYHGRIKAFADALRKGGLEF
ncbi:MAG: 50S ribosomal protein L18 [Candidatus Omnitrophica bacterium]|nr:50S ribosomal protein L18 [Candidatus Omnitrophota bacterium]